MSMKNALLITCAVIATTSMVRTQNAPTMSAPANRISGPPVAAMPTAGASLDHATTKDADTVSEAVDLSALRYFATHNEMGRVAAEIQMIRTKNPKWEPPDDLFSATLSGPEEQPLWDLFTKHDLAGIHAKMDEIRKGRPDWEPSSDLAGKLALAEAHDRLVSASDAKQWQDVIALATSNKTLLTCGDVDALWRTAEALIQTGEETKAVEAYRYVLANCSSPGERLATVQKASLALKSAEGLDSLMQMGKRQPDGRNEFEAVRLDAIRRRIGEATGDPSGPKPSAADLDTVAALAKTPAGQADAQLLGWYCYASRNYPEARQWFTTALATGPVAKAAEGLVLTLRAGDDPNATAKAALQYAGLDPANRKLMVEVLSTNLTDPKAEPLKPDEMATLSQAVDDLKSQDGAQSLGIYASNAKDAAGAKAWASKSAKWKGDEIEALKSSAGAEALGWLYYQSEDFANADIWFTKSAEWSPNEGAAVGLIMTARKLHHDRDYAARVAQYRSQFPRVAEMDAAMHPRSAPTRTLKVAAAPPRAMKAAYPHAAPRQSGATDDRWDRSADEIVKVYAAGRYDAALAMINERQSKRREPRGLSIIRGWAMYHNGDWEGAKHVFSSLPYDPTNRDREEGLRVIQNGYTNPRFLY